MERMGTVFGHRAARLLAGVALLMLALLAWPTLARNLANACFLKEHVSGGVCGWLLPAVCPGGECTWLGYRAQQPAQALETLERAAQRDPGDEVVLFPLGEVQSQLGREADAIRTWQAVPNADVYFANLSALRAAEGDLSQADRLMDVSLAIDPRADELKIGGYLGLCRGWRSRGEAARALPWCRLATYTSGNAWAAVDLAAVEYALGDTEGAVAALSMVHDTDSDQVRAAAARQAGQIHLRQGRAAEAVAAYAAAVRLGARDQWTLMGYATALLRTGNPRDACTFMRQAVAMGYRLNPPESAEFAVCNTGGSP